MYLKRLPTGQIVIRSPGGPRRIFRQRRRTQGAGFEKSYEMLERMEGVLMPLYENGEATRVLLRVPASFANTTEVNSVRGIVVLSPWAQRDRSMQAIMAEVNRELAALPGYRAFTVARRGLGGGTGKPVEFVLVAAIMMN